MKGVVRTPIMVVLLSFITCGIYYIYWIYVVTKEIKEYMNDESINPTMETILSVFVCYLYQIYWWYKFGKIMSGPMSEKAGIKTEDNGTLFIILAILGLSVVNIFIMQDKLNTIWEKN